MTTATLILAAIAAAAATCVVVQQWRADRPQGLEGQAVRVSTLGETVVQGVVHSDLPGWLILRNAVVEVVGRDARAPAGGLVHIPRGHVDIVQQLVSTRAEA